MCDAFDFAASKKIFKNHKTLWKKAYFFILIEKITLLYKRFSSYKI